MIPIRSKSYELLKEYQLDFCCGIPTVKIKIVLFWSSYRKTQY